MIRPAFWLACAVIAVLSLLPDGYLPPGAFDWWDKAQHALAFGVLGILGLLAYASATQRVLSGLLIFGAVIELAQAATGWRYGDWHDWLADAVGVGVAYLGWVLWELARSHGHTATPPPHNGFSLSAPFLLIGCR